MSVPTLLPRTKVRQFGPFQHHVYVVTHDVLGDYGRRVPLWLFVGVRRTRRSAQRFADQELARRLDSAEAHGDAS